jgi:FSR family fosmidomycin resistance protein-like MFS transporter
LGVSDEAANSHPNSSFLGLKGNALVMTYTETVGQGVLFLTSTFWSLYVLDLGASITFLGILAFIPGVVRILIQAPTGYISDRYGRKRLVVWGGLIASFAPFAYYLAPNWLFLIPGVILEAFTNAVLPARQAMFAVAVEPKKRATAFASFHTFLSIAAGVMPIVGGLLLERLGLAAGMKVAFLFTGVMMLVSSIGRAMFLEEDVTEGEAHNVGDFNFKRFLREVFEPVIRFRKIRVAIAGSFLFSLTIGILTRYNVVYAVDVIGLSKIE